MLICQKRGCGHEATQALKIGVGGLLDPDGAPPRCTIAMDVLVCDACLADEEPDKWFASAGDMLRASFRVAMAPEEPDFERAVVLGVPLGSPEHQVLAQHALDNRKH